MKIDKSVRINMIVNFTRDYLTIRQNANVSVLYGNKNLYVTTSNGMVGSDFVIDIKVFLEMDIERSMLWLIREIETVLAE